MSAMRQVNVRSVHDLDSYGEQLVGRLYAASEREQDLSDKRLL